MQNANYKNYVPLYFLPYWEPDNIYNIWHPPLVDGRRRARHRYVSATRYETTDAHATPPVIRFLRLSDFSALELGLVNILWAHLHFLGIQAAVYEWIRFIAVV